MRPLIVNEHFEMAIQAPTGTHPSFRNDPPAPCQRRRHACSTAECPLGRHGAAAAAACEARCGAFRRRPPRRASRASGTRTTARPDRGRRPQDRPIDRRRLLRRRVRRALAACSQRRIGLLPRARSRRSLPNPNRASCLVVRLQHDILRLWSQWTTFMLRIPAPQTRSSRQQIDELVTPHGHWPPRKAESTSCSVGPVFRFIEK
jgi:hypothetical protein